MSTKRTNNTTQTQNPTVVVIMIPSNTLQIQYFWDFNNVFEQSFPNKVLKIPDFIFWLRLQWIKLIKNDSKLLYKYLLNVRELKAWVK